MANTFSASDTGCWRLLGWHTGLIPAVACLMSLGAVVAYGEVQIISVEMEDQPQEISSVTAARPLRVSSATRSLRFHFTQADASGKPTARLRYKLEGYDETWRDLPLEIDMKLSVQFMDKEQGIVGTDNFKIIGETPGWTGQPGTSPFVTRTEQTTAPARSIEARVLLSTHGVDAAMGVIGLEDLQVTVHSSTDTQTYDWTVTEGVDLNQPLGIPANWERQGSRADMAQVLKLTDPSPRTILMLNDDDFDRHCTWSTLRLQMMQVHPGEPLHLQWKMAHSIGRSGPGKVGYPGLPPGHYWFRVAAAKANGDLTGEEVSLAIEVVAPLYRQWGFWVVIVALIGGTAAWLGRILALRKTNRQIAEFARRQEIENERSRIARDLHDDIGAGLTEIAMQSDWLRRELASGITDDTRRRAERVCQSATDLTRSVDEIVWAVTPENDTLERFANYLVHSTEQFLEPAGLKLRLDFPGEFPERVLSGKARHHLYLATREALNNVLKHAHAGTVRLSLKVDEKQLLLAVADDGCGFAPANVVLDGTREGLNNMNKRLADIGGDCQIIAHPGGGTRVEFRLPIPPSNRS